MLACWSSPCTKHKKYWNETTNKQLISRNICAHTQNKTIVHGHGLFNIKQSSFVHSLLNQLILSTMLQLLINEHDDAFKHISWTSSISVFIPITFFSWQTLPPFNPGLYDMSPKHSSSPNTALSLINRFKRSTSPFSLWGLHQSMNTAQHLKPSKFED